MSRPTRLSSTHAVSADEREARGNVLGAIVLVGDHLDDADDQFLVEANLDVYRDAIRAAAYAEFASQRN